MRFKISIILVLFVSCGLCGCKSTSSVKKVDHNSTYSVKNLQSDIDDVFQTINEVHPAFSNNTALSDSLRGHLNTFKSTINNPLSRAEFFTLLAPKITHIDDGHTSLGVPWADMSNYLKKGGLIFPFDIFFVKNNTYIYHNYSSNETIKPGVQLLSINGIPVDRVVSDFTDLLSGENIYWRHRRMEKQSDFFKAFIWLKYGWGENFTLVYSFEDSTREEQIEGITRQQLISQRDTTASTLPFEYQTLNKNSGLLTIRYFGGNEKEFEHFLKYSFKQINQNKITNLIIDVRDNPGGDSGQAEKLLSYLTQDSFPITNTVKARASLQFKSKMKERIPRVIRWLPLQYFDKRGRKIWRAKEGSLITIEEAPLKPKNKSQRFTGDLYLMINEGTFSSASIFASAFKREKLGVLIGRETGGEGRVMFAEPLTFKLQHTQLTLSVSSMIFFLRSENAKESSVGVVPNIVVQKNINDEVDHIDTILEFAKSNLEEQ
jgi:hypothetical protein